MVTQIAYIQVVDPPNLSEYVVVEFDTFISPPWDHINPKQVPISPIKCSTKKQIPLKMACILTINKSQRLTLSKATINIEKVEWKGLTFTTISRVKSLVGLHISHIERKKKHGYMLCRFSLSYSSRINKCNP